jgi:glycosyltransferase involved in cell wall biosynthesis
VTPRVAHVITGLQTGGAEVLLTRVLTGGGGDPESSTVISMTERGPDSPLAEPIEAAGIRVRSLGLSRLPGPRALRRLGQALREARPDVVQTWLVHANVLGGLAARRYTGAPVAWGVHNLALDAAGFGRRAALAGIVERGLAPRVPRRIVACSEGAAAAMNARGYPQGLIETIPNGFDVEHFRPDDGDRVAVRDELGVGADELVVGHVARFHPKKDQRTLLLAARRVLEARPETVFVLCGAGLDEANDVLGGLARPLGDRVRLLGERRDADRLYRGFDVFALSSAGEALPLVIGEAMASRVPVVSTDVGDARWIVAETGHVVAPGEPEAFARALLALLTMPQAERTALGEAARQRIVERYSLTEMVAGYRGVWEALASSSSS